MAGANRLYRVVRTSDLTTKLIMISRTPTENENRGNSLLDSSFPRTRESRFGLRPISLDTRFRGYDGTQVTSSLWETIALHVFSKEITKDTKVSDNYHSELRALRVLRGEYSVAFTRKRVVLSALVGFALLLMQISAGETFAASANNIRIGYPQPSGAMLPLWVMAEAKLDRKYGVDLQNIYISGGARLTQTLVSGDIELAATGGAVVNAVLSGADLTYVAASVPTYGFSLYVRNDVKDVPSLKGKVVGLMTKGASTDHGLTALLRQYNLRSGQDVKVLYLGGVREGLAALDRGIVSATTISAPTTLMARRMGYKELLNFADLKIPYIQLGIVAHRAFLRPATGAHESVS